MRRASAILSSVGCPALQYFSTLCHRRHDKKKVIAHKMCVFVLSTTLAQDISQSKKN